MKIPSPRGFAATSPTAAVCDHVANFSAKGKRATVAVPEPLDLATFYGLPASPYVRTKSPKVAAPSALATWTANREEKKIPMSFSPPRFKQTKSGPREVKWLLHLETVTVTVTTALASFNFTASNRGQTVLRGEQRRPLPMVRAELVKLLGEVQGAAACAELASVLAPPREARARKVREVPVEDKARWEVAEAARISGEVEAGQRRRERKANPPANEEAPNFAEMTAAEFAKFNAENRNESSWVALEDSYGRDVERVQLPARGRFPAPFTGEELD